MERSPEQQLRELSAQLGLGFEEQDWGIINADATRLVEFIDVYASSDLSRTQRWQVFELIMASMNEALQGGAEGEPARKRMEAFVARYGADFPGQLKYWARLRDVEEFPLARVLREIGVV